MFRTFCSIRTITTLINPKPCVSARVSASVLTFKDYSKNVRNMSNEVEKAQKAVPSDDTIFGKIVRKEIPSKFVYEDDQCVAIDDISPVAPVHFLVIPKKPIQQLSTSDDSDEQLLGHLLVVARKVAVQKGISSSGYRTVINDGKQGCQSVYHLHVHVIQMALLSIFLEVPEL